MPVVIEQATAFPLANLEACTNDLVDKDYAYLESVIQGEGVKAKDADAVRKAIEVSREVKDGADKVAVLKKYVPILVDLIYARSVLDGLIEKAGINFKLASGIYNLVDAVYSVAPEEIQTLANEAVLKIDETANQERPS